MSMSHRMEWSDAKSKGKQKPKAAERPVLEELVTDPWDLDRQLVARQRSYANRGYGMQYPMIDSSPDSVAIMKKSPTPGGYANDAEFMASVEKTIARNNPVASAAAKAKFNAQLPAIEQGACDSSDSSELQSQADARAMAIKAAAKSWDSEDLVVTVSPAGQQDSEMSDEEVLGADDDEGAVEDLEVNRCLCEEIYLSSGQASHVLVAMAIGQYARVSDSNLPCGCVFDIENDVSSEDLPQARHCPPNG
jgi:hypothetical protein